MKKDEILKIINSKGVSGKCPMCFHNNWDINENTSAAVPIDEKGNFVIGKGE